MDLMAGRVDRSGVTALRRVLQLGLQLTQAGDRRSIELLSCPCREFPGDEGLPLEQVTDVLVGDADNPEAAPGLPSHRALALQDHQRLTYRRGADAQVCRQALGTQELPGRKLA